MTNRLRRRTSNDNSGAGRQASEERSAKGSVARLEQQAASPQGDVDAVAAYLLAEDLPHPDRLAYFWSWSLASAIHWSQVAAAGQTQSPYSEADGRRPLFRPHLASLHCTTTAVTHSQHPLLRTPYILRTALDDVENKWRETREPVLSCSLRTSCIYWSVARVSHTCRIRVLERGLRVPPGPMSFSQSLQWRCMKTKQSGRIRFSLILSFLDRGPTLSIRPKTLPRTFTGKADVWTEYGVLQYIPYTRRLVPFRSRPELATDNSACCSCWLQEDAPALVRRRMRCTEIPTPWNHVLTPLCRSFDGRSQEAASPIRSLFSSIRFESRYPSKFDRSMSRKHQNQPLS